MMTRGFEKNKKRLKAPKGVMLQASTSSKREGIRSSLCIDRLIYTYYGIQRSSLHNTTGTLSMNNPNAERFNEIYASAPSATDDLQAMARHLSANDPGLFAIMARAYLERTLQEYVLVYFDNRETETESTATLGEFAPEMFAEAFVAAVHAVEIDLDDEEIAQLRTWLGDTHPEILSDILATDAETQSRMGSEAYAKDRAAFLRKMRDRTKRDDPPSG